jgi:putative phage-type endonuclease
MKRITHLSQGTDAWKLWRRNGVGGSDIAAIVGLSPFEDHTRVQILKEKVYGVERTQTQAMYCGTVLEPWARKLYQERHRVQAAPVCIEMDGCDWARVSLDGLCTNGSPIPAERLEWLLELKCPGWATHSAALAGVVPDYYAAQVQWQLLCCGLSRCDFVSFNPGQRFTPLHFPEWEEWRKIPGVQDRWPADWLAEVRLEADPAMQAWLLGEAAQFWFEVAEARADAKRRAVEATAEFA